MVKEKTNNIFDSDKEFDFQSIALDYLEFARKYHEQYLIKGKKSDLDNAVDNYIDAVKFNPALAEVYYRLASLLWEKGEINLASAIEQCKSAISISPDNINARIYTAYFLELAKNYEESEKEFKKAIKLNPLKSARSRLSLASLYMDKMHDNGLNAKDISQSIYYAVSGGLSIVLDYPSVRMLYKNISRSLLLRFYDILGNVFEKTKNYTLAVKAYDIAANNTGENDIFYRKIGDIGIKKEEISSARNAYIKALESNPYNKELLLKVAAVTQIYFEDDIDTAIDCYSKLLELEENSADIYYELGHLYIKKEDIINSINAFQLALKQDYENPFFHNALAFALVKAEQYDEACLHYKFAIDKNPEPAWTSIVCQTLASIYYNVYDDIDSALDLLKNAIVLDSDNDESFIEIGNIYMETDDTDSAIKAYCEAIKLNPKNAVSYNKCAMALWKKDYIEEAIIAYHKAININPDYYAAYNNLGVIYFDGIKNLKEAKRLFEKAVSLKPNYVMAYFNLGRVYQETGENIAAAKHYQKALELNETEQELNSEEIRIKLFSLFEV